MTLTAVKHVCVQLRENAQPLTLREFVSENINQSFIMLDILKLCSFGFLQVNLSETGPSSEDVCAPGVTG